MPYKAVKNHFPFQMVQLREGCQNFGCQESVPFKHGRTSDSYPETLLH